MLEGIERHLTAMGVEHPRVNRTHIAVSGGSGSHPFGDGKNDDDDDEDEEEDEDDEEDEEDEDEGGCSGGEEGGLYFYHPDLPIAIGIGSTSYITDASGEVNQHIEYMAFGEIFVEEGEDDDIFGYDEGVRYLFNAKELDALPVRNAV